MNQTHFYFGRMAPQPSELLFILQSPTPEIPPQEASTLCVGVTAYFPAQGSLNPILSSVSSWGRRWLHWVGPHLAPPSPRPLPAQGEHPWASQKASLHLNQAPKTLEQGGPAKLPPTSILQMETLRLRAGTDLPKVPSE